MPVARKIVWAYANCTAVLKSRDKTVSGDPRRRDASRGVPAFRRFLAQLSETIFDGKRVMTVKYRLPRIERSVLHRHYFARLYGVTIRRRETRRRRGGGGRGNTKKCSREPKVDVRQSIRSLRCTKCGTFLRPLMNIICKITV